MKQLRINLSLILTLVIVGTMLGRYTIVEAQKKEVVEYLTQRFQAENLPVTDIIVLEVSPLQLEIVAQSIGDYITPEDSINLHKIDREVFITARKNGYEIERYTRILQDSHGKQLYKLDQGAADIQQALQNLNTPGKSENDVKKILTERINLLAEQYNIQETKTKVAVSSTDGTQFLEIQFVVSSIDEAYRVFGFLSSQLIYPVDNLIIDANNQGGNIVMCSYKIEDDKKDTLFFYFFDYQLQRGTWSNADNFQVDLGTGGPPPSTP